MRRKILLTFIMLHLFLCIAACGRPEPSKSPVNTATPVPTSTTTPTSTPVPTPTNTPTPTSTPSPAPTNTPTPTSTPSPAPTNTPTPTSTPSPAPTNTPTPTPETSVFSSITYNENIMIDATPLGSEEEVNRYLFSKAIDKYYRFGILVCDLSLLHSEEEYLEMFPEFIDLEFESLTKYYNGYYLCVSNLTTNQTDLALRYAVRTGDTSFLTESQIHAYCKLFDIARELRLADLEDIEAILAAHDYLVLNTVYDSETAAAGTGGLSHYAEGLLLNNQAVCSGYASAFQLLMSFAGINCEYVFSDTHAWNLVQLEDEWYHMDVTWDDPVPDQPDTVIHTYFMMTDAEVSSLDDHNSWQCECGQPHHCNDESYRLYPYKEYLCSDESEAALLIQQQAATGLVTLVYPADGTLSQDSLSQLTFDTLQLTGNIAYFPADTLNSTHYLLRIIIR